MSRTQLKSTLVCVRIILVLKCYEVLQEAMTALQGEMSPAGSPFEEVFTYVVNPKSITMGQLYGEYDLLTHEWTDGILSSLVRMGAAATDLCKRWYVFDGPVDAVWIENMNTVLDDNKKLCLSSGEIIKLLETMTMMFEVADLAVASPATVSRCGMVYLEPSVLGLEPFINCWMQRQPQLMMKYEKQLRELMKHYLLPALVFLRAKLKEIVGSVDSALVMSFFNLMDIHILPLTCPGGKPLPQSQFLDLIPDLIVPWVLFSVIWSVGATCHAESREKFSDWFRTRMEEGGHEPKFPPGLVYDYRLHDGGFSNYSTESDVSKPGWIDWMVGVEAYVIGVDTKFADIEVPTIDNVRNAEILGMLVSTEHQVLCIGPTGTCKTVTISSKLSRGMHKKFICDFISFSARTTANQTQDLIDSKLDKRRKNTFGPPAMKKQVFFIDDLNMPALEVYGAQPPIELLRQWMDFRGWYDRKNVGEFRNIIDVIFVGAMGPPGGGRNPVTMRLLRHFHYLSFTDLAESSKRQIFGTILRSWLDRAPRVSALLEPLVTATLVVYSTILRELLPTPAKTHYTFNLRDLSKVFQGILMLDPESVNNVGEVLRLWYHECCRVFQDRLVNDADRNWFDQLLRTKIREDFECNPDAVLSGEFILYGDFMDPNAGVRLYQSITEMQKLTEVLNKYLEDYNSMSTAPMKLVMFMDAICHVCRISRIIRQPLGNALLLGMGGSGRQSLTRLAAHMAEYVCFQIELSKSYGMNEWREDIKQLMMNAGARNVETVFLFSDTQIKSESFLEDLNNVLNSGDVPNIYQIEELDVIYQAVKGNVQEMGLDLTRSNLYSAYLKNVRSNMHEVITMSPIGEVFRARLRQFPALVNCCTIDWFSAWPDAALQSVAFQFLEDIPDLGVTKEVLDGIVVMCQFMHQSVVDISVLFLEELSRHNYVTPTSYLELLSSYSVLLNKKKKEFVNNRQRLSTGLEKLLNTAEEVKVLQVELAAMQPALKQATEQTSIMLEKIAADRVMAEETKLVVEKEEAEAAAKAETTQAIADDAQRDLDEAMPMLNAAEASLKALNKGDISEVRAFKSPPMGVQLVMEAMCIVKNVKPKKIQGLMPGEKILDYWEPGRGLLANPDHFLSSLMNFDKESITEQMQQSLKPYIENPAFQPAKILSVSKACTSLCMWVHAIYKYYFVNKAVAPKKAALAQAKAELAITEAILAEAKAKMQEVLDGLAILEAKLKETEDRKAELEANMKLCEDRMDRAVRLVTGLADERLRWLVTIDQIGVSVTNVVGDILISAGAIAYLTPFTDSYRRTLLSDWLEVLEKKKVPHTPKCNPVSVMGEPVQIRGWQLNGLPRDSLSIENAVLVMNSKRWPLFIDPQGQANRWVRNEGKKLGIAVAKMSDRDLIRTLESAVRFGKACLIENVGLEIDPGLDSILMRQVFKQGGIMMIKVGDNIIPYNDDFRLFLTTRLPNPHYTPEVSIKVLLVNFALVPSGLQDQLLALVVMEERPDLEAARGALIVNNAEMKRELKEIEDLILQRLSASEGSPVDDIELINTLEASKIKSEEIKVKVADAEKTQIDIDATRAEYIPVANRGQILFFCLVDLANIDPMYQYSLEWFTRIFVYSMANTEKTDLIDVRVANINDAFTFNLYSNVCRSLFEKHKLHFAFLLCARIQMDEGKIDFHEWHHLLAGGSPPKVEPNPAPEWLSIKSWTEILAMAVLPNFTDFVDSFPKHIKHYQAIFDAIEPNKEPLPQPWEKQLNDFQRLLVLKALRPDKVTNAMQDYLSIHLGPQFIEPQTTDLANIFKESTPNTPLVFVLSTGTDPAADLYKFADKMKFSKRMHVISLGQGQGPRAEFMMNSAMEMGYWVFFQNCHLSPSWMPRLDYLVENINPDTTHRDFRMWLTSTPSPAFPVSILQNCCKMTVEPPRGLKANMMRAFSNQVTEFNDFFHSDHPKVYTFKWLLFSLCLFHGVCLERRKFGPLGFNIPYEFTDGDLRICISQLHMFLLEYDEVPFKVLIYTAGQINYGGRVTDDWDRRFIMNMLYDYYNSDIMSEEYSFDKDGIYHQLPGDTPLTEYLTYIRTFPLNDDPGLFGLHSNADITYAQRETYSCLATLLALQPKVVGGQAQSQEEVTIQQANEILREVPVPLDIDEISAKYPVLYEESLNTVLVQEVIRYNRLLAVIHSSLQEMLKALKGLVVMSEALESMALSLFTNLVPVLWSSKAYPSLKPLGAWVKDLKDRIAFLNGWIDKGIPTVFWISGFYFPQAFLTGTLQNFARKYIISIDSIDFGFQVLDAPPRERPADGCCIYGLFLEGARWSTELRVLSESRPKELYTDMSVVWLLPEQNRVPPDSGIYECPVYKTLTRAGTLSTTGHSTNYVVAIEIPSSQSQTHWIKRGVALICALDY
ncbi:dynein axonemal heavy chain 1 [Anabrus simplex]|uniref:dynein axonemal heavy chain 1 n=1 Tax=Anabrus simplex TaxID=316456 RepID=UPI0035A3432B